MWEVKNTLFYAVSIKCRELDTYKIIGRARGRPGSLRILEMTPKQYPSGLARSVTLSVSMKKVGIQESTREIIEEHNALAVIQG